MNKEKIIEIINKYNLDKNEFIILSGASLVLMGIKEKTLDIDITVTKDYYNYLINNYNCEFDCLDKNNNRVYYIDKIINFGLDYWTDDIEILDGIKIQSLNSIIQLKQSLNRDKDKKDLELIYKYKNKE